MYTKPRKKRKYYTHTHALLYFYFNKIFCIRIYFFRGHSKNLKKYILIRI